jgi:lincosamide nucleotidyltransferase A/C/D/E
MSADDVLLVLSTLRQAGVQCWLDGGWGIDALLGAEHRPHDDLDLVVRLDAIPRVCDALSLCSFEVAEDLLPTRLVMRDPARRQIDLHPISFDEAGDGWQIAAMPDASDCRYPAAGFTTGYVHDTVVGCLSAEVQLAHHLGYNPRPHDIEDLARVAERFEIDVPKSYGRNMS